MIAALVMSILMQVTGPSAAELEALNRASLESAAAAAGDAAAASAASSHPARPFDCVRDGSTPQINACLAQDLAAGEARMDRYLVAAREQARSSDELPRAFGGPSAQRAYLAASQAAWTAYARIVCEGVDDSFKDGSIHTAMFLSCMTDMTLERTRVIWRDHLSYWDSTPPILPEPLAQAIPE
ncbi:lysozyme inhibitor LprI family protein [Brevundimonas sp. SL161]|uniref:lysozyme inhibitor LprI family protein n=1 Tax=Brevundimonas sp. SL161 TaxID=2804613 RepID=UPI003CE95ACF